MKFENINLLRDVIDITEDKVCLLVIDLLMNEPAINIVNNYDKDTIIELKGKLLNGSGMVTFIENTHNNIQNYNNLARVLLGVNGVGGDELI